MLLEVKDLYKSYGEESSKINVLKGINLNLENGDIISLTGRSGSGKSTLLNIIGTLDYPDKGELIFKGKDFCNLKEKESAYFRNRNIGFIFQAHYLLPEFTSIENVMIPGLITGENRKILEKRAFDLLEKVGLHDRINHRSKDLSGGEQQRVAIARALINRPELILADEPTGNLDSENSVIVQDLLWNLVKENGSGLILVTHDMQLASRADRILKITDGVIL